MSRPSERKKSATRIPARFTAALDGWMLRRLMRAVGSPPVSIRLWNGEQFSTASEHSVGHLELKDRQTRLRLLTDPMFKFGEAYAAGRVEVHGRLVKFLICFEQALMRQHGGRLWGQGLSSWLRKTHRNTLAGSRDNIHQHYDIGNDFYRLWLDEQLVYTGAYFAEPTFNLEQAQVAKMDHVCRKLRLTAGETVIEAGCGWGALALHMARHYGAEVQAFNISGEQIYFARRRARDADLADWVEYIKDDWRNIAGRCRCDAFVSVGMLEHVGRTNYSRLGEVLHESLNTAGRGLIHTIGLNYSRPMDRWIERRIFPGAQPPTLRELMSIFEPHIFSVLDVETL